MVRRRCDVHLDGVVVQLRPSNAAQLAAAMPPGERRWQGALLDAVALTPAPPGSLGPLAGLGLGSGAAPLASPEALQLPVL